jgi:hypothetical protein
VVRPRCPHGRLRLSRSTKRTAPNVRPVSPFRRPQDRPCSLRSRAPGSPNASRAPIEKSQVFSKPASS